MKKACWIAAFVLIVVGLGGTYLRLNDGFCTFKIITYRLQDQRLELTQIPLAERAAMDAILDQPFHYLTKGRQSFVFESEDGKYVLKLVKQYKYWHLDDVSKIPMPQVLRTKIQELLDIRNTKKLKHLGSYKMAFERLKSETRILYLQLNRDPTLCKTLTVVDALGMKHRLSTEHLVFILQEKAVVASDYFKQLSQDSAKQAIDSIIKLFFAYYHNGLMFSDFDSKLMVNIGFCGDQAIALDAGGCRVFPGIKGVKNVEGGVPLMRAQLLESTKRFRTAFHKSNPELADYFEERIAGAF